jgi:hypothetical protein
MGIFDLPMQEVEEAVGDILVLVRHLYQQHAHHIGQKLRLGMHRDFRHSCIGETKTVTKRVIKTMLFRVCCVRERIHDLIQHHIRHALESAVSPKGRKKISATNFSELIVKPHFACVCWRFCGSISDCMLPCMIHLSCAQRLGGLLAAPATVHSVRCSAARRKRQLHQDSQVP